MGQKNRKAKVNIRLFVICFILLAMTGLLVHGLLRLTLVEGEELSAAAEQTSTVTTYQSGMRGTITDRNGVVLAYDEEVWNVRFYRDPTRISPEDSARYTDTLIRTIDIIEQGGGTVIDTFYIRMLADGTYVYDWGATSEESKEFRKKNFITACNFSNPDLSAEEAYLILRNSWQVPDDYPFDEARKLMSIRQEAVLNSYRAFEGVTIAENVPVSVIAELTMLSDQLTGILAEKSSYRVYPQGNTASHIVGYLGRQVTQNMPDIGYHSEDFAEFTSEPTTENMLQLGYAYSDTIGVSGVERSLEPYLTAHLTARQGTTEIEKNKQGAIVNVLSTTAAQSGLNVRLTIDLELQKVLEAALLENIEATNAKQVARIRNNEGSYLRRRADLESIQRAETGAAVVMRVRTGEILALASYPDYDPNLFTRPLSAEEYDQLFGADSNQPTLNRAIAIRTAPGSTFKMATGFAGLMEGKLTVDEGISDRSPYMYFVNDPNTKVTQNAPSCWTGHPGGHANLNLSRALAVSCNYYFFTVADRVGIDRLSHWAGQLGLSGTTNVELPGELAVQVGGQAARYDFSRPLSQQSSAMPRVIYNQLVSQLTNITTQAKLEVSAEQIAGCALALLELQQGTGMELGSRIRSTLQSELGIPTGISLLHSDWVLRISSLLEELRWKPTYTIQTGIGQGVSLLTPISLARYVSAIAARGKVHDAHIVEAVINADDSLYKQMKPTLRNNIDAPDDYWDAILEGLRGVVSPEDGGTASSVFSREFRDAGYLDLITGKTGTAQTAATGNLDIENTSWFVALTPRQDPELAIVVFIPNGLSGSSSHIAIERVVTYLYESGVLSKF